MFLLIGAALIIGGAISLAAIYKLTDNMALATVLQLVLLAAIVATFIWLR